MIQFCCKDRVFYLIIPNRVETCMINFTTTLSLKRTTYTRRLGKDFFMLPLTVWFFVKTFFLKQLRDGENFVFLQCQIVVRGREQFAFAAIFKLDHSDPHIRT